MNYEKLLANMFLKFEKKSYQKWSNFYETFPYISEKQDVYVKLFWRDDFVFQWRFSKMATTNFPNFPICMSDLLYNVVSFYYFRNYVETIFLYCVEQFSFHLPFYDCLLL